MLRWEPGARFFLRLNDVFNALLSFSREGAVFVFNSVGSAELGAGAGSLKDYLTRLGAESKDPVVQVIEEGSGEVVYTVRVQGDRFRPRVYAKGKYTVKAGRDRAEKVVMEGVEAEEEGSETKREVRI